MLTSRSLDIADTMTMQQKTARAVILRLLTRLSVGQLRVIESYSSRESSRPMWFGSPADDSLIATLEIKSPEVYSYVLTKGSIAAALAYQKAWWDSPDLSTLITLMATNLRLVDDLEAKGQWLSTQVYRLRHWLRKNSPVKARQNIEAHYDLGNKLYETFLDNNMLYSCALFSSPTETLEQAQINKMERICQQLNLKAGEQVLEIGTGWGGMAIYIAQHYGCDVTTTTISEEQYHYTQQKIHALGLDNRITLLKQDYRELTGRFDKLISIEMVEAVGRKYLSRYIKKCHALLKPGGLMSLQAITITDQRYDYYCHHVDFIQAYVFPGGFLPSITTLINATTKNSSLILRNLFDMGLDYAHTLSEWQRRFNHAENTVRQQGFDTEFIRLWRYYLSYCEGAFRAQRISCIQLTFQRA